VLSAALLLPLMIVLAWWSVWSVALTVILATVVSLIELYNAFRQGGYQPRKLVGIGSALALILAIWFQPTVGFDLLLPIVTFVIIISLVVELAYPLQQLDEWGYHAAAKLDPMTPATLIVLDGADGRETWLTFENFYTISRYNKSPLYSLAVYQLSQAIAAAAAEPGP